MSIRLINYNINASYGAYTQKLTSATKRELEEAGISYDQNTTESEAKILLANAKAKNNKDLNEQHLGKSHLGNTLNPANSLMERAVELAKRLGISINDSMSLQQILVLIEQALEQKISESQNDLDAIQQLREFSSELAMIQAQASGASGFDNTNQALLMSLEMLSEYNKNFIYR